ncbi:MAG: glycosyltransferase family 2 protein [Epsilonproteobacteria bacterium]|nr:glycosyltransferase family 2 protein [Campylobacterota bacterium]
MKISVLIDNYNYAKFLPECIDSVLSQTYQDFEIIIVDDGSRDNSKEIIEEYAKKDDRIKPIFKENGGQASAFNEGFKHCKGEIICLLDSDDNFKPQKLEKVAEAYKKGYEYIINDYELIGDTSYDFGPYCPYGGFNQFLVYYLSIFTGSTTSNVSISKKLGEMIFPIKNEKFFRVRADDVVVFGASMMSEMYFIDDELTEYRIHGSNLFACNYKKITFSEKYYRDFVMHQVKKEFVDKIGIDRRFFENVYHLHAEFRTKHIIDLHILKTYLKVLFFEINAPLIKKIDIAKKMISFYLENKQDFKPKKRIHF